MNADGSNQRVLIGVTGFEYDPVWSADGTKLYFSCNRFPSSSTLCVAAADGTGLRGITFPELNALDCNTCFLPTPQHWDVAPDGRSILFETITSPNHGGQAVWVADISGSSARIVTPGMVSFAAKWSPRGDAVLVHLSDTGTGYALATAKPDGSSVTVLSKFPDKDQAGEFSPDQTLIAFGSFRTGDQRIYTMNADGTGRHQLAPAIATKFVPRWNPTARPGGPFSFSTGALSVTTPVSAAAMLPSRARSPGEPIVGIGDCTVVRSRSSSRVVCAP
jgi:Tol biopolymer transport system component